MGAMRDCVTVLGAVLLVACASEERSTMLGSPSTSLDGGVEPGDEGEDGSTGASDSGEGGGDEGSDDGSDDGGPAGCPGGDAAWAEVLAEVEAAAEAQGAPGVAIAVVCDGELAHAAGLGVTRTDGGAPVTTATRFQLASVTKTFTGAAAIVLHEDGLVDPQAPVSAALPGVSYGDVTLHHLLTHTASYPTELELDDGGDLMGVVLANGNQAMWAPAGAVWNYSNPGYAVAGAVLEAASGVPFGELVESRVFAPAGMTRATMDVAAVLAEGDYAWGHDEGFASPIAPDGAYFQIGSYGPMGGAWASVEDLARWGEVVLSGGGAVMSADGVARMHEFHTRTSDSEVGYGYGVFVETFVQPEVLTHGGSAPGFVAHWQLVPDRGFGVFVLANASWVYARQLADLAMDRYVELAWVGGPLVDPVLSEYVGTYVDPHELGTIVVSDSGGQLVAQVDGGAAQPLQHVWEDIFTMSHPAAGGEIEVTFWRDGGEAAQWLVSIWGIATRSG
jgi:CubicO group peptidase (beta-lactamase class C family)